VTQGVTTEILGEGWTPAPRGGRISDTVVRGFVDVPPETEELIATWSRFADWLDHMAEVGIAVNYGSFLGGCTLREYAMGWVQGEPSPDERETMAQVLREAMADGAFGVATALIYPPNAYSTDAELLDTCRVLAETGGVYITHMRSESDGLLEALAFTIDLGRRTGIPVEIYHLKATGRRNWDKIPRAIELIDAARAEGVDVAANMYPYDAGCTGLASSLPPWAAADGRLLENLRDRELRARIHRELHDPSPGWEPLATLAGPEGVLVGALRHEGNRELSHRRLSEIAEARGQDWADCLIDLVLEEERSITTVYFGIAEDNVRLQLRQPWIAIATDARGIDPADPDAVEQHPRACGTYPRVLGRYVREEHVLSLEDAVRKMSTAVASRLRLRDRGTLREEMLADVVVFDPQTVCDHATYEDPHRLSTGVRDVWVNGRRALRDGIVTGEKAGRALYGQG
jgi:N-acyl-D-amino-acid deacylase